MAFRDVRHALAASVAIYACAVAAPAIAQTRTFNVPEQPAVSGIPEFARQADIQILVSESATRGRSTNAVRGALGISDGLQRLLNGTGLRISSGDGRTFTLTAGGAPGEAEAGGAAADEAGADAGATPEILVTGRRTLNTDIRRTENDSQPYVVLSRQELETSQASNLEDFFRTRLPMNTSQQSISQQTANSQLGNVSSVNLRGLGSNQTLILVDGRRLPGIANLAASGDIIQPDINGIPLSAIERIEVLPSTASGIYGGGATGGVINIILRRDYRGLDLSARYGGTFRGDGENYRFDASAGLALAGGRLRITLAGSYEGSDPLIVGDREFLQRGRDLLLANDPASILGSRQPLRSYTANVSSTNGANLILDNGTNLGSAITFVPPGYRGPATDGGLALVANAGRYTVDAPDDHTGLRSSLLAAPTVYSASANVRSDLGIAEIYADASFYHNATRTSGGALLATTLQPNDPNNPFTTAVNISYPVPGVDRRAFRKSETLRLAVGAIGRLGGGWTVGADYGWSRSRILATSSSPTFFGTFTTAVRNGPLIPLSDFNAFPPDFSPYLMPDDAQISGPFDTLLNDVSMRASGPLLELPGGAVTTTWLLQYRNELVTDGFINNLSASNVATIGYAPSRSQDVISGYAEMRAPLVSARNGRPGLRLLEVQASVRHDRYQTQAGVATVRPTVPSRDGPLPLVRRTTTDVASTDFTVGLRYAPVDDVILRASYGTGFLPPSVAQIASDTLPAAFAVAPDPLRGNVSGLIGPFVTTFGGTPNLLPERSRSFSVGLVLTPSFVPNLRVSADFTSIRKTDEIRQLTSAEIITNQDAFPGRIVRGPRLPSDPAGWAGPIISLDQTLVNVARSKVEAFDFQIEYWQDIVGFGRVRADAVITWEPTFEQRLLETSPTINIVGFANGPLEWRGNLNLSWERGPLLLGWSLQYFDSYFVYNSGLTQAAIDSAVRQQGSARISSQVYNDLFFRLRLGGSARAVTTRLPESELFGGIQNVFDAEPPILATNATTGGYSAYGDPRLRRFTIGIRARF